MTESDSLAGKFLIALPGMGDPRFKQAVINAARAARTQGYASALDQIVVTAGVPFNVPGTTNILRVAPCQESLIYSHERG